MKRETPEIVSKGDFDCGELKKEFGYVADLSLRDGPPIHSKPYQLDMVRQQQLIESLDQLVDLNLMYKSHSTFSSGVFLIPKAGGTLRLIVDLRKLNSRLDLSHYQCPNISDTLHEITYSGAKYFSKLDLASAYWALTMGPRASEKCALTTTNGIYCPSRLPFGLSAAPSIFSAAISNVMATLPKLIPTEQKGSNPTHVKYCTNYLDDLLIYTKTPEDMETAVKYVLRTLANAGLKIKLSKVDLFQRSITVLGRIIDGTGILPMPRNVEQLQSFAKPTCKKQLQQFLGLLAWLSPFIPKYSTLINPLTNLLHKDTQWHWTEMHDRTFHDLKERMNERTKIYAPRYDLPFYIVSDASNCATGAILYQIRSYDTEKLTAWVESHADSKQPVLCDDASLASCETAQTELHLSLGKSKIQTAPTGHFDILDALEHHEQKGTDLSIKLWHPKLATKTCHVICPIAFHSQTLSQSQIKWSIIHKEAYGCLVALKAWHNYLINAKATYLLTDSSPFIYLCRLAKAGVTKMDRWLMALSELPIKLLISHVPGHKNMADLLTRNHVWKVVPDTVEDQFKANKAYEIKSPFKAGEIITLNDIQRAIQVNPDIIRPQAPLKQDTKESKQQKIRLIGTNFLSDLMKALQPSAIAKRQTTDNYCTNVIENPLKYPKYYRYQGILYKQRRTQTSKNRAGRIVLPEKLIGHCLALFHADNHGSAKALSTMIKAQYFFPNIEKRATEFTKGCFLCQNFKATKLPKLGFVAPLTYLQPKPLAAWQIDVCTGFPKSKESKNGEFLTIVEEYSNYRLFFVLKTSTAREVSNILHRTFSIFGIPQTIRSDNATNLLQSSAVKELLNFYSVERGYCTSKYWAPAHGLVELANKVCQQTLQVLINQYSHSWIKLLPLIQLIINTRPMAHLDNFSPFTIMFGIKHGEIRHFPPDTQTTLNYHKHVREFEELHENTKTLIDKHYKYLEKKYTEQNIRHRSIPEGSFVLEFDQRPNVQRKPKTPLYLKPRKVIKEYTATLIVEDFYANTYLVHKNHVRPWSPRPAQLYANLPFDIKEKLGDSFSENDLEQAFKDKQLPFYYNKYESTPTIDKRITRSQSQSQSDELALFEATPDIQSNIVPPDEGTTETETDSSDDSDDEDETIGDQPKGSITDKTQPSNTRMQTRSQKRVTFTDDTKQ